MAEKEEKPYRISAQQLYETTKSRDVIPCTLSSDIALGGGIPRGCTVLIGGRQKMGKTTLCFEYAARSQKLFGCKVFVFPVEGRLTHLVMDQVKSLDKASVEVVNPPAIFDKAGKVVGFKKFSSEQWWKVIGETIENHPGCVMIVDSIANLSSEKEQSEGMGFQDRGGRNKLEAEFCRKYGNLVVANQITLFLITQVQANTSGYGPPTQMKVGNQIKFQADIILMGKNIEKWPETNGRILGHDSVYVVECSALGPPFMELKIPLRYGDGIDRIKDIVTHSINWGIIEKSGAWFTTPFVDKDGKPEYVELGDEKIKYYKFQGEENTRSWLSVNPAVAEKLESLIRSKVFG
jgi:recombination protein RecA